jgi:hypothetical protein
MNDEGRLELVGPAQSGQVSIGQRWAPSLGSMSAGPGLGADFREERAS